MLCIEDWVNQPYKDGWPLGCMAYGSAINPSNPLGVVPGVNTIEDWWPHFLIKYAASKLSSAKFKGATPI
jgi:hypothetical protein